MKWNGIFLSLKYVFNVFINLSGNSGFHSSFVILLIRVIIESFYLWINNNRHTILVVLLFRQLSSVVCSAYYLKFNKNLNNTSLLFILVTDPITSLQELWKHYFTVILYEI